MIADVEHGFGIWVSPNVIQLNETQNIVASDDEVTLHCGASVYNYTNQIDWFYKNGSQLIIIDNTNRKCIVLNHLRSKKVTAQR